ncbi:MAG: hypothetical protein KDK50_06265 [Chlamydiia bacterium]|nr:hypothetical protein [Chlamydiia bacterium]MCP5492262.1 hypothetical protein [Chlamydiales bacterium]
MKFKVTRKDQDIIASVMIFKEKWWLWVINIKNLVRFGIPLTLIAAFSISYLAFHKPKRHGDYFAAAQSYEAWVAGDQSKLPELERIMSFHPELHAKYDHAIASHLIASGQGAEAKQYAQASLNRAEFASKWHRSFANTSLTIADGDLQTALAEAKALKDEMSSGDIEHFKLVYGFNLMRIVALEKELDHKEAQKKAALELQQFVSQHQNEPEVEPLTSHFQSGKVSLSDYLGLIANS